MEHQLFSLSDLRFTNDGGDADRWQASLGLTRSCREWLIFSRSVCCCEFVIGRRGRLDGSNFESDDASCFVGVAGRVNRVNALLLLFWDDEGAEQNVLYLFGVVAELMGTVYLEVEALVIAGRNEDGLFPAYRIFSYECGMIFGGGAEFIWVREVVPWEIRIILREDFGKERVPPLTSMPDSWSMNKIIGLRCSR